MKNSIFQRLGALICLIFLSQAAFSQEFGVKGGLHIEKTEPEELEPESLKIGEEFLFSKDPAQALDINKTVDDIANPKGIVINFFRLVSNNHPVIDPFISQSLTQAQRKILIDAKLTAIGKLGPKNPDGKKAIKDKYIQDVDLLMAGRDFSNELWLQKRQAENFIFLPARNTYTNMMIHGENNADSRKRLSFLNSGGIMVNGADSKTSLSFTSELAAGYLGPLRISLSSSISDVSGIQIDSMALAGLTPNGIDSLVHRVDSISQVRSSIQNMLASGGLGSVKVSFPLLWCGLGRMRPVENGEEAPQILLTCNAYDRLNAQIPRLGQEIKNSKFGNEFGIEGLVAINFEPTGDDRLSQFRFLAKAKFASVQGKQYISSVGLDDMKRAVVLRFEGGFLISDTFYISYTFLQASGTNGSNQKSSIKAGTLGVSFLNF